MKQALVFLATGFEETEAVGTIDILRRGNVDVTTVSITGDRTVVGAHGIPVVADILFEAADFTHADMLVLPGGGPGSQLLNEHEPLKQRIADHHRQQKTIAAICAAPLVFGGMGLLDGRRATCYPGIEPMLGSSATVVDHPAVQDGHVITGKGPGLVFDFGLLLLENLQGKEVADSVAGDLLLR